MAREIKNILWGLGVGEGEGDGRGFTCVSYVALSLFVPHLPFFWCHGRVVLRDCGISLVTSLVCLWNIQHKTSLS